MENKEEAMASASALKAAKKELRSFMKQKLSAIPKESIDKQSSAVFKGVINSKPYQEAKRICFYLSMPTGEIQTDAIVRHALSGGKKVFVPYLFKPSNPPADTPKSLMDMVDLQSLSDYDSLKRDGWGIPTIGSDTVDEPFDVDRKSGFIRRLGHGKGFYDYFLHRYMQNHGSRIEKGVEGPRTDALLYGLALEEQFLESDAEPSVPVGEHDNLLHGLFVGNAKIVQGPVACE